MTLFKYISFPRTLCLSLSDGALNAACILFVSKTQSSGLIIHYSHDINNKEKELELLRLETTVGTDSVTWEGLCSKRFQTTKQYL